jgi:hypothetical protein
MSLSGRIGDGTTVIIPSKGYDPGQVYTGGSGSYTQGNGSTWGGSDPSQECKFPYVRKAIPYIRTTTVPGTPGSPGQPYIKPTAAQVPENNNEGWDNSCSSSVDPVLAGQQIVFEINNDSRGFFVGFAKPGKELQWIGSYKIGVRFDQNGLVVFESNSVVTSLGQLSHGDLIKIQRYLDGSIVYQAGEAIYKSDVYIDPQDLIYAYAVGFEADDQITSALIESFTQTVIFQGEIPFEQVVDAYSVGSEFVEFEQRIDVSSRPGFEGFEQVIDSAHRPELNGICDLVATVTLPVASASDTAEYNALEAVVTIPQAGVIDDSYIPPRLTVLNAIIAPISPQFEAITVEVGELEAYVSLPIPSAAEEEEYNALEAIVSLPVPESMMEFPPEYMLLYNDMKASDISTIMKDVIIPLYVGLGAADDIGLFKSALMVLAESVQSDDGFVIHADKQIAINEVCVSLDNMRFSVDDLPDHAGGIAWVMNIDSGATSVFLDYGFNSFIELDGITYGINSSGIWNIQETSAVVPASGIDYGLSSFGSPRKKRIPHFYAAVASSGKIMLRLLVDGSKAEYFALSNTDHVEPNKINVGRGFHAVFWNPILIAPEGVSIEELNSLEWQPMTFPRRV